jgi:hypothetical protein
MNETMALPDFVAELKIEPKRTKTNVGFMNPDDAARRTSFTIAPHSKERLYTDFEHHR